MEKYIYNLPGRYGSDIKFPLSLSGAVLVVFTALALAGCGGMGEKSEAWKLLEECDTYYNRSDTAPDWKITLDKVGQMLSGSSDHRLLGEYNYQKSCYYVTFTEGDSVPYYLANARRHYLQTDDNEGIGKVLLASAQYANYMMETDSARKYISVAMPYVAGNDSMAGALMAESVFAHVSKGEMYDAVSEGYNTCRLLEQSGDTLAYLIATGNIGVAYRHLGMTDSAMVCYNRALDLALPFGDDATTAYIYNNLSVLYCETKRFGEALDFAEKAMAYAQSAGDQNESASAIANKASALGGMGQYGEAVDILTSGYRNIAGDGSIILKMKYISYIVDYSLKMQKTDSVDYYIGEGERLAKSLSPNSISGVGLRMSKVNYLIFTEDYSRALGELDILGKIKENIPVPEHKRLELMAGCYAGLGNYSRAYELTKLSAAQADSIRNENAENKLAEFTARYETKEKELEIEQLKKEKAMHDAWIARLTGILISLVLGITVIVILMMFRRKTERQKKEIMRARNYIAGMESERARFARELHDGACNDLLAIGMEINSPAPSKDRIAARISELRTSLRHISHELMPPSFRLVNLNEILEYYLRHLSTSEVKVNYTRNGEGWGDIRKEVAYEMYRIAQETVSNIIKHSHAGNVDVELTKTDGMLSLEIRCDGQWKSGERTDGIGLRTVRERALSIGAELDMVPEDGNIRICMSVRDFKADDDECGDKTDIND